MSFEEELEQLDREEWLAKFDDIQIMNAAKMYLEWLFYLPDDWQPDMYPEPVSYTHLTLPTILLV